MNVQELAQHLEELPDWVVVDGHHLEKSWRFADFAAALAWINRAGAVCEMHNHHADFTFGWGRATARIWTHSENRLTEKDFALAAALETV